MSRAIRTKPKSASSRGSAGYRVYLGQRLGVAVFAQRDDHPVTGLEDADERAVISGPVGAHTVAMPLDHYRFTLVDAADEFDVDLEDLLAPLDCSPKRLLVQFRTGDDAPVGEVVAEQREAFVEISASQRLCRNIQASSACGSSNGVITSPSCLGRQRAVN